MNEELFDAACDGKIGNRRVEWAVIFAHSVRIVKDVTDRPGETFPMMDDVLRFAALCSDFEIKARNQTFRDTIQSEVSAVGWIRIFWRWAGARAKMWQLVGAKSVPESYSYPGEFGTAAFNGWLLKQDEAKDDVELSQWLKSLNTLSDESLRIFSDYVSGKKKGAVWNHPELDKWLMCIWPLVTRFGWTYRNVLDAAKKKFPTKGRSTYPMDDYHSIRKHCNGLGLKTTNAKGTRKRQKIKMLELALKIGV